MGHTIHFDPDGGVHVLLVFASGHGCGVYLDAGYAAHLLGRIFGRRDEGATDGDS